MKQIVFLFLMMGMSTAQAALHVGDPAPDFSAPATGAETVSLSDYKGQWVILYFYPKADTPGCTKQGCSLRDGYPAIQEANAVVLGVSVDSVESQEAFKKKYQLPFPLISDKEKTISKAYKVLGFGGLFARRHTFFIDPEGTIAAIMEKVDVANHEDEVLNKLQELQAVLPK